MSTLDKLESHLKQYRELNEILKLVEDGRGFWVSTKINTNKLEGRTLTPIKERVETEVDFDIAIEILKSLIGRELEAIRSMGVKTDAP